jgi:ribosomal protein S18 acetylase RimI-like enzyme
MYIGIVSEVTQELHEALQRLIPQLGVDKISPTPEELHELVKSESSTLLAARYPDEHDTIVGILSLIIYRVPTGMRCIIEDVIVDEKMRRLGIGAALMRYAMDLARESGVEGVSLTSKSQREAANHLYQSLGFELRKTNPYFYRLK